ncbi:MAG: RNA ligase (ATP) [bacterium]
MERKMAHIEVINNIFSIPNADAIECLNVLGWEVVAKKGSFKIGDKVVYLEIDSWCPHELAPFLSKGKEPRIYNGIKGERVKSIRLRGQISQGLVLPINILDGKIPPEKRDVGLDVADVIGIQKWEREIPAQLQGQIKCDFPTYYISKTNVERIQNYPNLFEEFKETPAYIAVKIDGTSSTFVMCDDELHVCSRNFSLKETQRNTYWKMFYKYDIKNIIEDWKNKTKKQGLAIQGEVAGPGIQKNPLKLTDIQLFVFDVYDVEQHRYFSYQELMDFCSNYNLPNVPIDNDNFDMSNLSVEDLLNYAKGNYSNGGIREGIVVRPLIPKYSPILKGRLSIKAINNDYLL